ncbi:MAG: response regulator [Planctomycetota bacterium]|nr:response regulator [Planctomycetota bacterium]
MKRSTVNNRGREAPLKVGEAAQHCRVSRFTVLKWVRDGKLKAYTTPGGHHRIEREDLLAFLEKVGFPIPAGLTETAHPKVLLVDDEIGVTDFLARALKSDTETQYEVFSTQSGYEACILVGERTPDLVVLDIKMPGIDGIEVTRRILSNPARSSIQIIAVTGYPSEENVQAILEAGAKICLPKPLDVPRFLGVVHKLLGVGR